MRQTFGLATRFRAGLKSLRSLDGPEPGLQCRARGLFRGGLCGFGKMLRHDLAALHDLLRLLVILIQGGLEIIRAHMMQFSSAGPCGSGRDSEGSERPLRANSVCRRSHERGTLADILHLDAHLHPAAIPEDCQIGHVAQPDPL